MHGWTGWRVFLLDSDPKPLEDTCDVALGVWGDSKGSTEVPFESGIPVWELESGIRGHNSESSASSSVPQRAASCSIDGMLATCNVWRWRVQQCDPKLLEIPNLSTIMDTLNMSGSSVFDLRLPKGRLASMVLQHCVAIITAIASKSSTFKIGITTNPHNRWFSESFGYFRHPVLSSMTIISILRGMEAATYLEAALIREFMDHPLCQNQALGGEGAIADASPAFVYVVSGRALASATNKQRRV